MFVILLLALFTAQGCSSAKPSGPWGKRLGVYLANGREIKLHGAVKQGGGAVCTDPPQVCIDALNAYYISINNGEVSEMVLLPILDTVCGQECNEPISQYFACSGQEDVVVFQSTTCGQEDGNYCIILWADGVAVGEIPLEISCANLGTCNESCSEVLNTTSEYLGCCTASLFGTMNGLENYINPTQFITCETDVEPICGESGVARATAGRIWIWLIFVSAIVMIITRDI